MNRPLPLFAAVGLALLIGTYVLMREKIASSPSAAAAPAVPVAPAPATEPVVPVAAAPMTIDYVVAQGRRVSGPETIRVHQGDEVVLNISGDHADELHVHGYDLHGPLTPSKPLQLRFTAEHSGRFDMELHHSDLALGTLEVMPR